MEATPASIPARETRGRKQAVNLAGPEQCRTAHRGSTDSLIHFEASALIDEGIIALPVGFLAVENPVFGIGQNPF